MTMNQIKQFIGPYRLFLINWYEYILGKNDQQNPTVISFISFDGLIIIQINDKSTVNWKGKIS